MNFYNNEFGIFNVSTGDAVIAENNWWGHPSGPYHPTQNPQGQGDSVNVYVDITPFLTSPNLDAPPLPVQNLEVISSDTNSVILSWESSPLSDVAGYKVHYDTDTTNIFYSNSIDAGDVTSFELQNLQSYTDYYISVTCYDVDDNESWYSRPINVFIGEQVSEFKLLPGDGAAVDIFGQDVAISGNYSIVGARLDDDNGDASGSAYIFRKDNATWIEEQKLLASDGDSADMFGQSVSISGDYAIVGAMLDDDNGTNSGSAYIFKRNDTSWIEQQKLTASDGAADDKFGISASISGDYLIVGAYNIGGGAYIFRSEGSNWIEEQKLTTSAINWFGFAVSISGDYAIVGAYANDGAAYIFKREGSIWIEEQKLTANSSNLFGSSVSISGDYAIVGAFASDAAYIFKREGSIWIEEQKLTAIDGTSGDHFGFTVSLSGDYAIVGSPNDNDNGTNSGSVYIFRREGSNWIELQKRTASDGAAGDLFGSSVSISGNNTIVGAYEDDDNGNSSGSAYVYNKFIVTDINDEQSANFTAFRLNQNYPNPFNPRTTIQYEMPKAGVVTLKVYNILGQEIITLINGERPAGSFEVEFDATILPSGIYFYKLQAVSFVDTKKMVLMK